MEEVAADSPGASVAADLATGEHGGPRQAAFAMAGKARTKLELCFCFTKVDYSLGAALRKQNLAGHSRFLPHTQHGACFLTLKPHTWMFSGRRCEGYSGGAPGLCGGAQAPSAGSSSTHEKSKKERSAATFAVRLMMPTTSPMSRRHGAQAFYTLCSNPTELRWTAPSPQRVFS